MSNLFYLFWQCLEVSSFSRFYPTLTDVPHLCKTPVIHSNFFFLHKGHHINLGQWHCIQHGDGHVDSALDRESGHAYDHISTLGLIFKVNHRGRLRIVMMISPASSRIQNLILNPQHYVRATSMRTTCFGHVISWYCFESV